MDSTGPVAAGRSGSEELLLHDMAYAASGTVVGRGAPPLIGGKGDVALRIRGPEGLVAPQSLQNEKRIIATCVTRECLPEAGQAISCSPC